jgi:hypothetical protein
MLLEKTKCHLYFVSDERKQRSDVRTTAGRHWLQCVPRRCRSRRLPGT